MPPTRPQYNPHNRSLKKVKILKVQKSDRPSLLSEYFYLALAILFAVTTFFLMGFGMRWDEAGVISLWVVGIIFFIRQLWWGLKSGQPADKEKKKPVVLEAPEQAYKSPELPRVSKNFSPMPPAGDKRYPPPSPFIKPPK